MHDLVDRASLVKHSRCHWRTSRTAEPPHSVTPRPRRRRQDARALEDAEMMAGRHDIRREPVIHINDAACSLLPSSWWGACAVWWTAGEGPAGSGEGV